MRRKIVVGQEPELITQVQSNPPQNKKATVATPAEVKPKRKYKPRKKKGEDRASSPVKSDVDVKLEEKTELDDIPFSPSKRWNSPINMSMLDSSFLSTTFEDHSRFFDDENTDDDHLPELELKDIDSLQTFLESAGNSPGVPFFFTFQVAFQLAHHTQVETFRTHLHLSTFHFEKEEGCTSNSGQIVEIAGYRSEFFTLCLFWKYSKSGFVAVA
jgi:hypothetical protein